MVCPKSNENDFFAQRRKARKGKWGSRQVEGEPRYKICTVHQNVKLFMAQGQTRYFGVVCGPHVKK